MKVYSLASPCTLEMLRDVVRLSIFTMVLQVHSEVSCIDEYLMFCSSHDNHIVLGALALEWFEENFPLKFAIVKCVKFYFNRNDIIIICLALGISLVGRRMTILNIKMISF